MTAPLLELRGLVRRYGGILATDHLDLTVIEGETHAIIGPNGAGKTSMLNVINGFYHPQEGTITYKGQARRKMRPHNAARQGIARTFQNVALFKGMSTLDNIMTGRLLKMRTNLLLQAIYWGPNLKEEVRHREFCERIIDFLEIQAIRKTPVGRLPYGLQKRVELARALAMEPDLLLLDEPMAGMSQAESQQMTALLSRLRKRYALLLVEHDMEAVFSLADRISVLVYGRCIASASPAEIRRSPEVQSAYLGDEA